jgi:peptidoglycan/LPS O-acetylase OafA/YrhL
MSPPRAVMLLDPPAFGCYRFSWPHMSDRNPPGRILELDGLRGIAILVVMSGHYFAVPGAGITSFLNGYWFRLGWTGVDLFFVLSGFLIGGILLDVRTSPRYFKTFYARRFFRIIPLYYAWIAIYIFLVIVGRKFLAAHFGSVEGINLSILGQFLFLQNFHDSFVTVLPFWWFNTTWSLAVEEQFYLISPFIVRYLSRRALIVSLITVTIAAPLLRLFVRNYFNSGSDWAYLLMPCRADSLAIGMLAAVAWSNPRVRDWLAARGAPLYGLLAILFAGVSWMWRYQSNPGLALTRAVGYTWLALFFAVLMLLALSRPASPLAAVLRLRLLRDIGGVSYCIYIIHTAVFMLCHQILLHALPVVTDGKVAAVTFLSALITYAIAKLSWKFLEEPMLQRGHEFKY